MSKTIKVIELINKIANGEKVPKIIKYGKMFYTYDEFDKDYITEIEDNQRYTLLFNVMCTHCMSEIIEATVQIIEEEPEIDIQSMQEVTSFGIKQNQNAINELIKAVKQLDKRINGDKTGDK